MNKDKIIDTSTELAQYLNELARDSGVPYKETIYKTFKLLLENKAEYEKMSHACNPYGDGPAFLEPKQFVFLR